MKRVVMKANLRIYLALMGVVFIIGAAYGAVWHRCVADISLFTPPATMAELASVRAKAVPTVQPEPHDTDTATNTHTN